MTRWSEYFQKLLNVPGDIEPEVLENTQKRRVNTALDEKPTMDEVLERSMDSKMEKHPVETEFQQKYGNTGSQFVQQTTPMDHQNMGGRPCTTSLEGCQHSHHLQKRDRTECGNDRGISLSASGKIFARILLNRLSGHITPDVVPETQCGFSSNRSTVDMIFCLR